MAKSQSGLPEGFDLNVTAEDLSGPATLAGYLDEDPVVAFAKMQRAKAQKSASDSKALVEAFQKPLVQPALAPVEERGAFETKPMQEVRPQVQVSEPFEIPYQEPKPPTLTYGREAPKPKREQPPQLDRKRLQINLDGDTERMLEEILNLLSSQSSENQIKVSELFQALLMNLYNAKGEIVLGSLPTRGRWGSPTAKAFPVNLAESLREAIVNNEKLTGGSPFKKVVGG